MNQPKVVTVFGASGFLGRHVTRALAKRGYRVRAAVRRPDLAFHLQPLGDVSQITAIQSNLRVPWSVDRAVEGADAVVNLVGILFETGKQKFDRVQEYGARAVAEACKKNNLPLVHISAIGADENSESSYARSKGRAENHVRQILGKNAIIMRPSIVFGPEDQFFNKFAAMTQISPALPLPGGGETKFQPVYVGDVAEAIAKAVDGELKGGETYELGGREVLSFRECMEELLTIIDRKRMLVPMPWWAARLVGRIMQILPKPMLTADQVTLLQSDNVVSEEARKSRNTLEGMGIKPKTIEAIVPSYLWQYREFGQFHKSEDRQAS